EEWLKESALVQLEYETKQAYYDTVLASAMVRVAEGSVRTFQRNLADAEQILAVGRMSEFEVLRARTELGSREAGLVAARNAERLAFANLRRVLALPQHAAIALEPKLGWEPDMTPVEQWIDYAFAHRPEILALEKAIQAAEQDVRRVQGQFKPSVGGTVQYQNTGKGGAAMADGWTFSIGGEWELYAGGRRKYEVAEAKANLSGLEHQLEDLYRLVELDVTQAHIQLRDAMAKIRSERGTLDLGREGLRLAEVRFKEGAGTQSETLDAELALRAAESSLVQALRDYAVANASLERAVGKRWSRIGSPAEE
ncbi:MAG: TolC family protein, partial [Candidatus Hydrogenedentes bacterium]|nr:TolC family protein [Candidatus Hydrogenedentota bacterium]